MGTPTPVVMAEQLKVLAMEIKKCLVKISPGKLDFKT